MKVWDRIIVGEGWGALSVLLQKSHFESEEWLWIRGSSAHLFQPGVEFSKTLNDVYVARLRTFLGHSLEPSEVGVTERTRVWKNKSFRMPVWSEECTEELRLDSARGNVWVPEAQWLPLSSERVSFDEPIWEIEFAVRERIESEGLSGVKTIAGDPIEDIEWVHGGVECILGSGQRFLTRRLVYCDRIVDLVRFPGCPIKWDIQGKSKALKDQVLKGNATGIIQVLLKHDAPYAQWIGHTWVLPMQREAGEKQDRHVIGSFGSDGCSSLWTLTLTSEEVESNQLVAKKLRRIKQALSRSFEGELKIKDELVRFEENAWMTTSSEFPSLFVVEQDGAQVAAISDAWGAESLARGLEEFDRLGPTSASEPREQNRESEVASSGMSP